MKRETTSGLRESSGWIAFMATFATDDRVLG